MIDIVSVITQNSGEVSELLYQWSPLPGNALLQSLYGCLLFIVKNLA